MKKTFLTFVAVGFGVSVAFAQTAEPADVQQQEPQEQVQSAETMVQAEESRREVEMTTLPAAVQEGFQNGQYSDMEVLAIYEVTAEDGTEATIYQFELAEASESTEMEGVETENVSNRQADLLLHIDENGQVVEEKKADELEN